MALCNCGFDSRCFHQKNSGGEKRFTRQPHKLKTCGSTPLAATKIRVADSPAGSAAVMEAIWVWRR